MFGIGAASQVLVGDYFTLILFEIMFFVLMGLFIYIGAKIAQARKASLPRSILAAIIIVFLTSLIVLPFSGFAFIGLIISLFINIAVIKIVFSAKWRRAIVTWVFSVISEILVFGLATFLIIMFS